MTGTTGPGPGTTGLVLLSGSYGNNGSIPVTAGDRVVMSYRGKVTGDGCTRLRVSAYRWDAAGTATAVTQNLAAVENPENDTWYRVIGSLTVPADGTASIGMRTGCSEMPFDSTTTFTVDEAMIVVNPPVSNPTPGYLDGDTPGASWAGASDASTSNGVPFSGTW